MRTLRSGGQNAAFSLFAFQDILTTTIGVVLLIMLLLVLEISKDAATAKVIPQVEQQQISIHELEQIVATSVETVSVLKNNSANEAIAFIQSQIKEEQEQTKQITQGVIDIVAKASIDPNPDIVNELYKQIEVISKNIEELEEQITDALDNSEAAAELATLRNTKEKLEHQLRGLLANDSLVYIKQDDPSHTPFLVEVGVDYICIHGHGVAQGLVDVRLYEVDEATRIKSAVSIIEQLVTNRYYPLILVRRGGGSSSEIIRFYLKNQGIASGIDLLVGDQTSIPEHIVSGDLSP